MKRWTKKEKERLQRLLDAFDREYGMEDHCFLNYETPWQLLIATILSAQCTDARVNEVTKELFVKYPLLQDFASANVKELEQDIFTTGFYHNKAKNIILCAQRLLDEYEGVLPRNMEDLLTLAGVGRKTANVIRSNIYHEPSIIVDTHVGRIAQRLGLATSSTPDKIEQELMQGLPRDHWIVVNRQWITLGRSICTAPRPKCSQCFVANDCPYEPKVYHTKMRGGQ